MDERLKTGTSIKYRLIYEELKNAIQNGQYMAGSFLPTESQLMESYAVSRTTVRKAMALLQEDGVIKIGQGRGTEVLKGKVAIPPQDIRILYNVTEMAEVFRMEGERGTTVSSIDMVQADGRIAESLSIEPFVDVYRIQRLKFCGDCPYDYVISYVPQTLTPGLEKFSGEAFRLKRCMRDQYHVSAVKAEEVIYTEAADFMKAHMLRVKVGDPLMVVSHTAYDEEKIIEYTESFMRTDIYRKKLILGGGIGDGYDEDSEDEIVK